MKTQHSPRFLAALCLLALWFASACANKNNVAENEQVDGYAETADGGETPTEESANATEAEIFGESSAETPAAETTAATDAAKTDPAVDSLFDPSAEEVAAKSAGQGDAAMTAPTESAPPAVSDTAATTGADPLVASTESATDAATVDALAGLSDPANSSGAQAFSDTASFSKKASYTGAVVPRIPERAVTRSGKSLNRYYFLRQGDTAKSVSSLLYGDASHSTDLKKWNKGRWMPGKVVYFASSVQPDDAQMISFYDERGLTPDQHKVGAGETMSTIAKKMLGSVSSWKELAVVNGLTRPDSLKRGQTIKVFTSLEASTPVVQTPVETAPAQIAPPPAEPVAAQPPMPADTKIAGANTAPDMGAVPPGQDPLAEDLNKPKKKPRKEGGLNFGRILSQNSFALTMALGIGLLALALRMVNKRKGGGGGGEDFSEDAFSIPEKKKRG